jgi:hypothetical protein
MSKVSGIVEDGKVRLLDGEALPDGARVTVELAEPEPLEREPWTEEDLRHDLEWARGHQWTSRSTP